MSTTTRHPVNGAARLFAAFVLLVGVSLSSATDALMAASDPSARVDIVADEYSYEGVPQRLDAGTATFGFKNVGQEVHEALLVRINPGHTLREALDAELEGNAAKVLAFSFAKPGKSGKTMKARLANGRYAFVCLVPDKKKRPHHRLGQIARFRVG